MSDRERSVRRYGEKLGLDVVQNHGHWETVGRSDGSGLIHLCQTSEVGIPDRPEPGVTGIGLSVPGDLPTACAALEANGVKFRQRATKESWGWTACVLDPDGNELTLMPENP